MTRIVVITKNRKKVEKPKNERTRAKTRFWIRGIYQKREELGEHHRL